MMRGGIAGWSCAAMLAAATRAVAQDTLPPEAYVADFDALGTYVAERYAYWDAKKTDWAVVRETYRPRAAAVGTRREFVALLERVIGELYDPHAALGVNTRTSPRLVPSGTDLYAEWRDGRAVVAEVRRGSAAERAGVRPGMEVLEIGGSRVEDAVAARMPSALREPDPAARDWALQAVLAGTHDAPVRLLVREGRTRRSVEFTPGLVDAPRQPLTADTLPGGIGLVRIHDSLGDHGLIAAFDSALARLRGTRGLVLDLRDTPRGGNTTVARAMMGRLITREQPYQRHEIPAEERAFGVRRVWVEHVAPRGPFAYTAPVVVLVGRWTGSMGEGLAIGLDGMGRATVAGTPMARLLGAIYDVALPRTGFVARIPAEKLFHVSGAPREAFVPPIAVDPTSPGDPWIDAALRLLAGTAQADASAANR